MADANSSVGELIAESPMLNISYICNMTLNGRVYQLHGESSAGVMAMCHTKDDMDPKGAAMYAIVTISVFATAIGFFIGMMSFKKKKYDEWDRQAGFYLETLYERKSIEERDSIKSQAQSVIVPHLGILELISGMGAKPLNSHKSPLVIETPSLVVHEVKRPNCEKAQSGGINTSNEFFSALNNHSFDSKPRHESTTFEEQNEETSTLLHSSEQIDKSSLLDAVFADIDHVGNDLCTELLTEMEDRRVQISHI